MTNFNRFALAIIAVLFAISSVACVAAKESEKFPGAGCFRSFRSTGGIGMGCEARFGGTNVPAKADLSQYNTWLAVVKAEEAGQPTTGLVDTLGGICQNTVAAQDAATGGNNVNPEMGAGGQINVTCQSK